MSTRRWIVLIALSTLLLGLAGVTVVSGESPLTHLTRLISQSNNENQQEEVVARVNDEPIYRWQLENTKLFVRTQGNVTSLPDAQNTQVALSQLVQDIVLRQEAQRRGIKTSVAEAQAFAEQQRELAKQLSPDSRQMLGEAMEAEGLNEDEYWDKMAKQYVYLLNLPKLRQQIYQEVSAPSDEKARTYLREHPIQNALVLIPIYMDDWGQASVIYADLTQKRETLGVDELATEMDGLARKYRPQGVTQPAAESYQFTSATELPKYVQEALNLSEEELGLVEDSTGHPVIVLVLSKLTSDETATLEYARNQLQKQQGSEHFQSVVEQLIDEADIEIVAPDLKQITPQLLPDFLP